MFDFNITDELNKKLKKISKKNIKLSLIINKKIKEIISNDYNSINKYKNLRYDLKNFKRVHIGNKYVLIFKVVQDNNLIIFEDFNHHDNIYR